MSTHHPSIVVHLWVFVHSSPFTQHLLTHLSFPSKKREMLNMQKKKNLYNFLKVYMELCLTFTKVFASKKGWYLTHKVP